MIENPNYARHTDEIRDLVAEILSHIERNS